MGTKRAHYFFGFIFLDHVSYTFTKFSDFWYNEFMYGYHKNILSENARRDLESYIEGYKAKINPNEITQDEEMGKIYFHIQDLPYSISKELNIIADQYELNTNFLSTTYTKYSGKYGKPKLEMHTDKLDTLLLIDYQYSSNTSWDLIVEKDQFELKDNDAVVLLSSGSVRHGRPEKNFSENDYIEMLFFDFIRSK